MNYFRKPANGREFHEVNWLGKRFDGNCESFSLILCARGFYHLLRLEDSFQMKMYSTRYHEGFS
jgi:hypothetical protein